MRMQQKTSFLKNYPKRKSPHFFFSGQLSLIDFIPPFLSLPNAAVHTQI